MKIRKFNRIRQEHLWLNRNFSWCLDPRPSDPEKYEAALRTFFRDKVRHIAFHPLTNALLAKQRTAQVTIPLPSLLGKADELIHCSYARVQCFVDGDLNKPFGFEEVQAANETIRKTLMDAESACQEIRKDCKPAAIVVITVTRSYHQYVREFTRRKLLDEDGAERAWDYYRKSENVGVISKAYDIVLLKG